MTSSTTSTSLTLAADATPTTPVTLDLMVAYTPQARINNGGVSGMETLIMNAVAQANQAYLNSQVYITLNLVAMPELNYVELGPTFDLTAMSTTPYPASSQPISGRGKGINIHILS
jgi:hypothetical protein